MGRLAAEADAAVFGPGTPTLAEAAAYWRRVEQAVTEMHGAQPWGRRVRARVSLASLRRSRRVPRAGGPPGRPLRRVRRRATPDTPSSHEQGPRS